MSDKKMINKATLNFITYALSLLATVLVLFMLATNANLSNFFASMENRTFDLRQILLANPEVKKPSKDIVIIAIDDPSYEYLWGKYGEWPIPREVYAKLIDYIELQHPKAISFDLMFIKSLKSSDKSDEALVEAMRKYNNVYTAMNFDVQPKELREPIDLPNKFKINLKNDANINLEDLTFTNCRGILPQILQATLNVGMINVSRSDDGILRKMPLFVKYKDDFYPHLALKVGMEALKGTDTFSTKNFYIDKHANLILGKRSIPIDDDGGTILNWYGPAHQTFTEIPFYQVEKAFSGDKGAKQFDFKNKIVYIGTTAVSLFDAKSVPVSKVYPGVELHATYVNNILDDNFIKKVDNSVNIAITLVLALFIGYIVIKSTSTFISLGATMLTTLGYIVISFYVMKWFNLWIGVVLPVSVIILVFALSYIIKYLLKSRDFEHQYKLATTDGLTELYNHRYFQEQMIMQIDSCKRYNTNFSLILIDIDFFKKFNDTYGHQAGDAVLKQVAYVLRKNVRSTDIVCRYGGEEMSIILSNTAKEEAIFTAEKICQAMAKKAFRIGIDIEAPVTISLGVATYPQDGTKSSELIETADKGLYKAKENGRNQVGLV